MEGLREIYQGENAKVTEKEFLVIMLLSAKLFLEDNRRSEGNRRESLTRTKKE